MKQFDYRVHKLIKKGDKDEIQVFQKERVNRSEREETVLDIDDQLFGGDLEAAQWLKIEQRNKKAK